MALLRPSWTSDSDSASNALVASSKSRIDGLPSIALAIAILWICPPEKFDPLSVISVSYFSGSF